MRCLTWCYPRRRLRSRHHILLLGCRSRTPLPGTWNTPSMCNKETRIHSHDRGVCRVVRHFCQTSRENVVQEENGPKPSRDNSGYILYVHAVLLRESSRIPHASRRRPYRKSYPWRLVLRAQPLVWQTNLVHTAYVPLPRAWNRGDEHGLIYARGCFDQPARVLSPCRNHPSLGCTARTQCQDTTQDYIYLSIIMSQNDDRR